MPELSDIIAHLPLRLYLSRIFSSADTDYEKPHRGTSHNVLQAIEPTRRV